MLPVPGLAFQRCVSKLHMIRNCKVLVVIAGYSPPTGTPSPSPPKGTPSPGSPSSPGMQSNLWLQSRTHRQTICMTHAACSWLAFQRCVSKLHMIRNCKVLVVIPGYSPPTGTPSPSPPKGTPSPSPPTGTPSPSPPKGTPSPGSPSSPGMQSNPWLQSRTHRQTICMTHAACSWSCISKMCF